ncbi:hypothetical protein PCA10_30150 [Metapseudomonas resinovorans NBRC 106553]|uniref:Uncharacterized protein n=1 Tax=Metapseudomonas resinovorans NBRC 106553 TaxID=1245471 RepID=S6AFI4_METRE|nr:hypothetical protein PCA10_30150 [Pseudomonas resinovorans NBRC 106553]
MVQSEAKPNMAVVVGIVGLRVAQRNAARPNLHGSCVGCAVRTGKISGARSAPYGTAVSPYAIRGSPNHGSRISSGLRHNALRVGCAVRTGKISGARSAPYGTGWVNAR